MLQFDQLTIRDAYSYSAHWHLWLNHEWLSELARGAIYNALGIIGLKLMKFLCSAATLLCLTLALAETGAPMSTQVTILLVASVAVGPQMQFRPQLFTFALTSALLAMLARYASRGHAPLWLAIPMLALWANLHGGFIIGLAILATFTIVVVIQDLVDGTGTHRPMMLFAILAASTLATLVTPYGIGTGPAWRMRWPIRILVSLSVTGSLC
jgi:hypothetical protein